MRWGRILLLLPLAGMFLWTLAAGAERASALALVSLSVLALHALLIPVFCLHDCRIQRHITRNYVPAGEMANVEIKLSWRSLLPLPWLIVREEWTHLSSGQTYTSSRLLFPWFRKEAAYSYSIRGLSRGTYRFERTEAITGDWFGLVDKRKTSLESAELIVFAHPAAIPGRTDKAALQTDTPTGLPVSSGEGFSGLVRNYEPGDPLNRIHWKATARNGSLRTRESAGAIRGRTLIFLDRSLEGAGSREGMRSGVVDPCWERRISLAAGLLEAARRSGREVSLYCGGVPHTGSPGSGEMEFIRMHKQLAELEPENGSPMRMTDELLHYGLRPGEETQIYCLPSRIDERLVQSLKLVRSGRRQLTILYVPGSHAAPDQNKWEQALRYMGCEVMTDSTALRTEGGIDDDELIVAYSNG
ncbi:DUF58 domain-containing protein [Paenibacillus sp. J2TS4]|uniref:DUF58 domain-containing protein n=1 Tax=Paenibacillus sp. J2TS4 TaxID=2807194 RepID=UPI001B12586A|nr:DUF58 domain-containing protein [Paenibacillus sp. J2TS4]GIP34596.1 hypothetical protein J2TS4_38060 [Paenibacillus sp. J2TS4]